MSRGRPEESRRVPIPELSGRVVASIGLQASGDYVLHLAGAGARPEIRIERGFALDDGRGVTDHRPADPTALGRALSLAGGTVAEVTYSCDGDLEIGLTNGLVLRAASDPDYENWHVWLPDRMTSSSPGLKAAPVVWKGPLATRTKAVTALMLARARWGLRWGLAPSGEGEPVQS